jgi:hypothetical protein
MDEAAGNPQQQALCVRLPNYYRHYYLEAQEPWADQN